MYSISQTFQTFKDPLSLCDMAYRIAGAKAAISLFRTNQDEVKVFIESRWTGRSRYLGNDDKIGSIRV